MSSQRRVKGESPTTMHPLTGLLSGERRSDDTNTSEELASQLLFGTLMVELWAQLQEPLGDSLSQPQRERAARIAVTR